MKNILEIIIAISILIFLMSIGIYLIYGKLYCLDSILYTSFISSIVSILFWMGLHKKNDI